MSGHSHDHHHHSASSHRRLITALTLTVLIFLAEAAGALISNSISLLADAGHMLVDSLGLVVAVVASTLVQQPRSNRRTWGLARAEVLAATIQATMLLVVCSVVVAKAIESFIYAPKIHGETMALFGVIGMVGNLISLFILMGKRDANLNMRAVFLEVANDALGSLAVIVAAGLTWATGWTYWDPIASLLIAAMMAPRACSLLRKSVSILMEIVPEGLDPEEVRQHLLSVEHVEDVHDLHITTIATNRVALTAHITVSDECFRDGHTIEILHQIQDCAATHFPVSIKHSTIQIDSKTHRDHEYLEHLG